MMESRCSSIALGLVVPVVLAASGCRQEQPARPESPRPVVAAVIAPIDPGEGLGLTGVVESWAQEKIAFEVSGRVTYIVEADTELEGRWIENGQVLIEGDVLATIDPEPYEAALDAAKAEVQTAKVNLEKVLPARLDEAKALLARAQDELERLEAIPAESLAANELVNATSNRNAFKARVDRAVAELEAGRAELARAEAAMVEVRLLLEYTTLRAPFSGEVADVYVVAGGYARAGIPVADLVMMNPVTIELTVSAETNRTISLQDKARVYVPGVEQPLIGAVYQKATVADAATRTFAITVACFNRKRIVESPADPSVLDLPRVTRTLPITRERAGRPGPLFVEENKSLKQDDEGYFVWAAEDMTVAEGVDPKNPSFTVRKVRVVPGERRINYQGLYLFRELSDPGSMEFEQLVAVGVPDTVSDGDRVALLHESWVLQPGSLVEVRFRPQTGVVGFYVPLQAIMPLGDDRGYVYLVEGGTDGPRGRAARVDVTLHEDAAQLRRIESVEPNALNAGDRVIVQGVNYVQPGEEVSVVETMVVTP